MKFRLRIWAFLLPAALLAGCVGFAAFGGSAPTAEPTPSPDAALQALQEYFQALTEGDYARAAGLYGGDWEVLRNNNPLVDPQDYAALLENGCEFNGFLCSLTLRAVTSKTSLSDSRWQFIVELNNADGSTFVLGPCCGADATIMPSVRQFTYTVEQTAQGWQVLELPIYVP